MIRFLVDAAAVAGGAVDVLSRASALQARSLAAGRQAPQQARSRTAKPPADAWGQPYGLDVTGEATAARDHMVRGDPLPHLRTAARSPPNAAPSNATASRPGGVDAIERWEPLIFAPPADLAASSLLRCRVPHASVSAGASSASAGPPESTVDSLWLAEAASTASRSEPSSSVAPKDAHTTACSTDGVGQIVASIGASQTLNNALGPPVARSSRLRERFVKDENLLKEETSDARPGLKPSQVPSSRIGRLLHYGSLAAGLGWGVASEAVRRSSGGGATDGGKPIPMVFSEANVQRLVGKLSRMRGAALKLGQFMSIQDANVLPPQVEEIFLRVQNSADHMPLWQTEQVIAGDLGDDWRSRFAQFSDTPLASASIGQVHSGRLKGNRGGPNEMGDRVAIKVQFPGVHESISSDLSYLKLLLSTSSILPKGLFLQNTIKVLGRELRDECDYRREAWCGRAFAEMLNGDQGFRVPKVYEELSGARVLTTEFMEGTPLTKAKQWPQRLRDQIGYDILKLCLREILHFRLMQTDPNWTNFLWNWDTQQVELIDFGATREYSEAFVEVYLKLLLAAIRDDKAACVALSQELGYLTGDESEMMIDAHVDSLRALGEPFRPTQAEPYPFASQTITDRVRAQVPVMLRHRLTPPPEETYSLNRKLSGAFLLCSRLGSVIECRALLEEVLEERPRWIGTTGERARRLSMMGNSAGGGEPAV